MFEETQKFQQNWIWIILSTATLVAVSYHLYVARYEAALISAVIFGGVFALLDYAKLKVSVDDEELSIKFIPFHLNERKISLNSIEEVSSENYSPIKEFGGWGLRWNPFTGSKAYNVSGNQGVRIKTEQGKEIVIGSQKPDELAEAIQKSI